MSAGEITATYRVLNTEIADFLSQVNKSWADPTDAQSQKDRFSSTKPGPCELLAMDRLIATYLEDVGSTTDYRIALMDRDYVTRALLGFF